VIMPRWVVWPSGIVTAPATAMSYWPVQGGMHFLHAAVRRGGCRTLIDRPAAIKQPSRLIRFRVVP
jgi:hypothetical protein